MVTTAPNSPSLITALLVSVRYAPIGAAGRYFLRSPNAITPSKLFTVRSFHHFMVSWNPDKTIL